MIFKANYTKNDNTTGRVNFTAWNHAGQEEILKEFFHLVDQDQVKEYRIYQCLSGGQEVLCIDSDKRGKKLLNLEKHLEDNMHPINKLQAVSNLLDMLGIESEEMTTLDSVYLYSEIKNSILKIARDSGSINKSGITEDRSRFLNMDLQIKEY